MKKNNQIIMIFGIINKVAIYLRKKQTCDYIFGAIGCENLLQVLNIYHCFHLDNRYEDFWLFCIGYIVNHGQPEITTTTTTTLTINDMIYVYQFLDFRFWTRFMID